MSLPSAWAEATSYKPIYTGSRPRPCGSTKARNANPIIEATYQTNLLCRTGAHFCTGLLKLCPQRSPFLTPLLNDVYTRGVSFTFDCKEPRDTGAKGSQNVELAATFELGF